MLITLNIPDDIATQLGQEAAETALSVEGLALYYLRAGMLLQQAERRAAVEQAQAEQRLIEQAAKRKRGK